MVVTVPGIESRRLTLADYEALPDDQDYEIVEGILFVAPRARALHQIVASRLAAFLIMYVEAENLGVVVPDADLIIDAHNTYVSPDIMLFLGDRMAAIDRTDWLRVLPDLIVEVISPASTTHDQRTKRDIYARVGVPHYWIVYPQTQTMSEYVLHADGLYHERTTHAHDTFTSALLPDLHIDLPRLFR